MPEALREPVDSEKVDQTEQGKPGDAEVREDGGPRCWGEVFQFA